MTTQDQPQQSEKLRVLVADDDPIARELITARLASLACECEEAEDGIVAWQAIMTNSFDMAIVDLSMPNLDGFELLRCVRNHPRTKHLPMVVVTSLQDQSSIEEALASGATSFLTKPINWTTFSAHIGYLLKLSHKANEARKQVRHTEATSRAKDAVLGNVLSETAEHARRILGEVNDLLTTSTVAETSRRTSDALNRLARVGQDLQGVVNKANRVVKVIPESVTVEDQLALVSSILKDLHQGTATTAAARDVELVFIKSTENPTLRCDAGAIVEALTQLVVNAVGHSRSGQVVKVSYQTLPDDMLVFEVADDGAGMNQDYLAKVLSPLAFNDSTPSIAKGDFGLGLPIAKAIAEAHGGTLELRSMPNEGTTAILTMPPERVILAQVDAA